MKIYDFSYFFDPIFFHEISIEIDETSFFARGQRALKLVPKLFKEEEEREGEKEEERRKEKEVVEGEEEEQGRRMNGRYSGRADGLRR